MGSNGRLVASGSITVMALLLTAALALAPAAGTAEVSLQPVLAPIVAITGNDQLGRQPDDRRNPLTPRPVMASSGADQLGRQPDDRRNPLTPRPVMV